MRKEKEIENEIYNYLLSIGAVAEKIQSWKIMIKKGQYNHRMTLQSAGCPDIICLYKWYFVGIEVKKDQKEVDKWLKIRDRFHWIWKTLDWLTSFDREKDQIRYAERIENSWWEFLITCSTDEVRLLIKEIDEQYNIT